MINDCILITLVNIRWVAGVTWWPILTVMGLRRLVQDSHKETRVSWADPEIAVWFDRQVSNS